MTRLGDKTTAKMTYEVRKVLDIPKPSITDYVAVNKTRETPGIKHTENEAPWICQG